MPNTARWYAQGLIHAHEIVMREMQGVCPTKQGPFRGPCNTSESHRVFCCLHGTCPDDLPSRGLMPLRALVAGFLMTTNFAKPSVNDRQNFGSSGSRVGV